MSILDSGCGLILRTDSGFEIRIEADFIVITCRTTTAHSPGPSSDSSGLLESPEGQVITASTAETDGAFALITAFGHTLHVAPCDDFEAWMLAGPRGQKMVCLPGGELAVWEAETP